MYLSNFFFNFSMYESGFVCVCTVSWIIFEYDCWNYRNNDNHTYLDESIEQTMEKKKRIETKKLGFVKFDWFELSPRNGFSKWKWSSERNFEKWFVRVTNYQEYYPITKTNTAEDKHTNFGNIHIQFIYKFSQITWLFKVGWCLVMIRIFERLLLNFTINNSLSTYNAFQWFN